MRLLAHESRWRQRISAYQDGTLSGEKQLLVEQHLRTCAACQQMLLSYEQIYRDLRMMPGFAGRLRAPQTVPNTRRTQRRLRLPWSGGYHSNQPSFAAGLAAVLIVLLAITLISSRELLFIGPSSDQALPGGGLYNIAVTPTLGAFTSDGQVCANDASLQAAPYLYGGENGNVFLTTNCDASALAFSLPYATYRVADWSNDGRYVLTIGTASGPGPLAIGDIQTGTARSLSYSQSAGSFPTNFDEAIWVNDSEILARAGNDLYSLTTATTPPGGDATQWTRATIAARSVTHLIRRGTLIYVSVVKTGSTPGQLVATIDIFDPVANALTTIFDLGAGSDPCASSDNTCLWNAAWDISPDNQHIVYQAPLPTNATLPSVNDPSIPATLTYEPLQPSPGTKPQPLFALPYTLQIPNVLFSPDSFRVAAQAVGAHNVMIASVVQMTAKSVPASTMFVWRNDGLALIFEPLASRQNVQPRLYLILTGQNLPLTARTFQYQWQP